jgi:hypothetical protein
MPTYSDGDFTQPALMGPPEITYPLAKHDIQHIRVKQRMIVRAAHYAGPPLNEPHPNYPQAYCTGDESPTLVGPMQQFDRIYYSLPKSGTITEIDEVTYPPIGATTGASNFRLIETGGTVTQHYGDVIPRNTELTLSVPVTRHREYFIPGLKGGYASLDEVELTLPLTITDSDGIPVTDTEAAGAQPSAATYTRYVLNGFYIQTEPTTLTQYAGNIWLKQNTYARAR